MKIERIELHHIRQPLVHPFRTSFGVELERPCILVAVYADGLVGWGECPTGDGPWYSAETTATAWHALSDFLAPAVVGQQVAHAADLLALTKAIRGHNMARAGLENAFWDLLARSRDLPLATLLGGVRDRVPVGVSIGIQPTLGQLLARVDAFIDRGYGRIKVKIEPGWEQEPLTQIRARHATIPLMADANSAFTLADAPLFRALDDLGLLMIEQPLAHDDIADHARLQAQIATPLCLDESIHGVADAQAAIDLQACRIINMKVARVGGLTAARRIHDLAQAAGWPLWCGGMLETGVGRACNIHLATLPNFILPGDISATDRYYAEDIAEPAFLLNREDSTMSVPAGPGIGVDVMPHRVARYRQDLAVFTPQ